MMPVRIRTGLAALILAGPVAAHDFSAGSEADSWGLLGEETARFEARVVDILCELSGDCPENCGGGDRQLGLLRTADDVLVMALKNGQPLFTGAVEDLLPYCGQTVVVDGLLVGEPGTAPAKFYQVQTIRPEGAEEAARANRFTDVWAEENPTAAQAGGEWFRNDPDIRAQIEAEGYLGLGPAIDDAFIAEWF